MRGILPFITFDDFRVRFGPDLKVQVKSLTTLPDLANFTTAGSISLNGPLDPNIELRGVLQLLTGRIWLFTSNFNLDRKAPNVAVFTPSQGLIPYMDIAMKTRVYLVHVHRKLHACPESRRSRAWKEPSPSHLVSSKWKRVPQRLLASGQQRVGLP